MSAPEADPVSVASAVGRAVVADPAVAGGAASTAVPSADQATSAPVACSLGYMIWGCFFGSIYLC